MQVKRDGCGVRPLRLEDLERLERYVRSRVRGRVQGFRLWLHDEAIILGGCAYTYYAKQPAQHAVMEATGLPIRRNEIQVSRFPPLAGTATGRNQGSSRDARPGDKPGGTLEKSNFHPCPYGGISDARKTVPSQARGRDRQ